MKGIVTILFLPLIVLLNTSFYSSVNHKMKTVVAALPIANCPLPIDSFPQNYFGPVLDIAPPTIVGNFGEPRRLHFHTGLDFRTNQEEGHKVFAAADGFVSRINVNGAGYGNALYITHASS